MKFIFKSLVYILFFIFMLIIFLPKENIYYFVLEKIKKEKIEITQGIIEDKYLKFIVEDMKIRYDDISVAKLDSANIDFFIFQTNFYLKDIEVDQSLNKFIPNKIKSLSLNHNLLNPLYLNIDAKFKLGSCKGVVDIFNRTVKLDISVAKGFKKRYRYIVNELKLSNKKSNNKEDIYSYEYKF